MTLYFMIVLTLFSKTYPLYVSLSLPSALVSTISRPSGRTASTWSTFRANKASSFSVKLRRPRGSGWSSLTWPCEYKPHQCKDLEQVHQLSAIIISCYTLLMGLCSDSRSSRLCVSELTVSPALCAQPWGGLFRSGTNSQNMHILLLQLHPPPIVNCGNAKKKKKKSKATDWFYIRTT